MPVMWNNGPLQTQHVYLESITIQILYTSMTMSPTGTMLLAESASPNSGVTRGRGGRTAPGDTVKGVTPE